MVYHSPCRPGDLFTVFTFIVFFSFSEKQWDFPGSWVALALMPCSPTPVGPENQASCGSPDIAFRVVNILGPTLLISGLYHTACWLAVYASQPESLPNHARLATGCWLGFAGRNFYSLGHFFNFQGDIGCLLSY
jgi:hypothetical protein